MALWTSKELLFAAKAMPVGVVTAVAGVAVVKNPDGIQRLLELGQQLFSNDQVQTEDSASVVITLNTGGEVTVEPGAQVVLGADGALTPAAEVAPLGEPDAAPTGGEGGDAEGAGGSSGPGIVGSEGGHSAPLEGPPDAGEEEGHAPLGPVPGGSEVPLPAFGGGGHVIAESTSPGVIGEGALDDLPTLTIASVSIMEPPGNPNPGSGGSGGSGGGGGHEGEAGAGEEGGHEAGAGGGEEAAAGGGDTGGEAGGHEGGTGGGGGGMGGGGGGGHGGGAYECLATASFTVQLSHAYDHDVMVDFRTADGTAISGGEGVGQNDYGHTEGTLVIHAGETSGTIYVDIFADCKVEGDEYFVVELSNPRNAHIGQGTAVGVIQDEDIIRVGGNGGEGGHGGGGSGEEGGHEEGDGCGGHEGGTAGGGEEGGHEGGMGGGEEGGSGGGHESGTTGAELAFAALATGEDAPPDAGGLPDGGPDAPAGEPIDVPPAGEAGTETPTAIDLAVVDTGPTAEDGGTPTESSAVPAIDVGNGEVLNITDVLDGFEPGASLDHFVQVQDAGDGVCQLFVNPAGTADGGDFQLLATLHGLNTTPSVDDLVDSGTLVVTGS